MQSDEAVDFDLDLELDLDLRRAVTVITGSYSDRHCTVINTGVVVAFDKLKSIV